MKYERNYGIDLLRLVLMYMVCMLHTLGQGGILGVCQAGTVSIRLLVFRDFIILCGGWIRDYQRIYGRGQTTQIRKTGGYVVSSFFYSFVITMLFPLAGCNPVWGKSRYDQMRVSCYIWEILVFYSFLSRSFCNSYFK